MSENVASLSCGIVMPISAIDGCDEKHWADVQSIIIEACDAITEFDVKARVVSDADDVGMIHKRIVRNLYNSDVIICDVSGKNPNVMFELGMRLAFDKPTIIVKDDKTNYSFDTGVIEHLQYPRDLRFHTIVAFKESLARKIVSTYQTQIDKPDSSVFLKNFGAFKVASLDVEKVSSDTMMLDMLQEIQSELRIMRRGNTTTNNHRLTMNVISDLAVKASRTIKSMADENPRLTVSSLLNDEELMRRLEDELDASDYFPRKIDFRAFIESIAKFLDQ